MLYFPYVFFLWVDIGKFNIEVQSVDRYNLNNLYLKIPRGQGASSLHQRS